MSDQFRKRRDIERRRQKSLKPDYLEEIKLDNQKRHRVVFGGFEIDAEFRTKHPADFAVARGNRDRVFSCVEDPLIFLRERTGEPVFAFFSSCPFEEFVEIYGLDGKKTSSKQLFQRLHAYAEAIKTLIKDELRQWPMRAFVKDPFPLKFNFSNRQEMAATVTILDVNS